MSADAYRRAAGALTSAALRVTAAVAPRYLERRVAHRFLTPRRPALPAPDRLAGFFRAR